MRVAIGGTIGGTLRESPFARAPGVHAGVPRRGRARHRDRLPTAGTRDSVGARHLPHAISLSGVAYAANKSIGAAASRVRARRRADYVCYPVFSMLPLTQTRTRGSSLQ